MSKFDKISVLNKIGSTGMVPVFYHKDAEVAKKVVKLVTMEVFVRSSSRTVVTLPTRCLRRL